MYNRVSRNDLCITRLGWTRCLLFSFWIIRCPGMQLKKLRALFGEPYLWELGNATCMLP